MGLQVCYTLRRDSSIHRLSQTDLRIPRYNTIRRGYHLKGSVGAAHLRESSPRQPQPAVSHLEHPRDFSGFSMWSHNCFIPLGERQQNF